MNGQTFIILCRRGLNRDTCPVLKQEGMHCCECNNVGYFLRESQSNQNTEEKQEENNNGE